ncbi:MAG: energy transducer TonB [Myxococcales bacterium]|nr:energy transducer TonB [Myxococcales bacterium]
MTAMATRFGNATHWASEATWVVLAILTHAALLGGMPTPPRGTGIVVPGDVVDVSFIEEPEPDEPVPSAEPDEPEEVKPPPKPKTFKAPKEPPTAPEEPPAAARETPVAFDNVVLTNESDGESSWAIEQASGKSVEGPIGSPNAAVTGRSKSGIVGGVIGGSGTGVVVDVGDLSKRPIPPPLKRKLERLYPKKARAEGVEGAAATRLQIGPDGLPSQIRVTFEDPKGYEFGDACVQALRGEVWQPPRDEDGKPVSTRVTYRCGFEIRY